MSLGKHFGYTILSRSMMIYTDHLHPKETGGPHKVVHHRDREARVCVFPGKRQVLVYVTHGRGESTATH